MMQSLNDFPANNSVQALLAVIHAEIREKLPGIGRIAFALHDPGTDLLKTFGHSTDQANPLPHYAARLADVPSLQNLAKNRKSRVIDDLSLEFAGSTHASRISEAGYLSSFTKPIFDSDRLLGFLFYDSAQRGYFTAVRQHQLVVFTQLITMTILNTLFPVKVLRSAVELASALGRLRDEETGAHLERMSRYSRIIADEIAPRRGIADEIVEFIFLFAPLHDVGKIGIPDSVLLKQGPLTDAEFEIMKGHPGHGARIVDKLAKAFDIADDVHVALLRNIVLHHHESFDGSGYPAGLSGEAIPLEARIVTVADVYDALTSTRPYKSAWPTEDAFKWISEKAGSRFDPLCVEALCKRRAEIEAIQAKFQIDPLETVTHEAYFEGL